MVSNKPRRKTAPQAFKSKNGVAGRRRKAASEGGAKQGARPLASALGARSGSKQSVLAELLCRSTGAGIADLVKALGWLPHTVRAAVTGLPKKGFTVTRSTDAQGVSVYRATPPAKSAREAKVANEGG